MRSDGRATNRKTAPWAVVPFASDNGDPRIPHDREAERSILGAIVLDNSALNVVLASLRPQDFFFLDHRTIFECMIRLAGKQSPIEDVTMFDDLKRTGELEAASGTPYISKLADGMPRVSNVAHYARIVRRTSRLRHLLHEVQEIEKDALAYRGDDENEVFSRAGERIAALCASTGLAIEPSAWREMFHTYQEFEDAPSLSFSIRDFLQNDGATMIGGLSGHGKTLILLSITKALFAGKGARLWDLFEVEGNAVRVLYLIPECSIQPFKHRLKLFGLYEHLRPEDNRLLVRTLSKGPTPCLSDPRILFAAKGAHVILDTAARFSEGDENSAGDNMRGLASDIFALLGSGARDVIAAHHSPKPFARENVMRLENVLRGSGDIGAMLTTAWGIKQLNSAENIIHIENIKPRDFQPCQPFQIIGRPHIDESGDFQVLKRPGECGSLMDEQEPERERGGGAPQAVRDARVANLALMRGWLRENPGLTSPDLVRQFANAGIKVGDSAIRKYRKELRP
jgi:hypothetical protein